MLEEWAVSYGSVFQRPGPLGSSDVVIMDPAAVAHVLGKSSVRLLIGGMGRCTNAVLGYLPHPSDSEG
jgi:hypothetical protein